MQVRWLLSVAVRIRPPPLKDDHSKVTGTQPSILKSIPFNNPYHMQVLLTHSDKSDVQTSNYKISLAIGCSQSLTIKQF